MNQAELLQLSIYLQPRARQPWTFAEVVGHSRLRYYSLARWALAEALKLVLPKSPSVLVPDFICRDVLGAVRAAGKEPVLYPVDEGLTPARDLTKLERGCAILAVNYFGMPQDLEPFERYCRQTGALLIEDNAHGLFGRDADGRPLGSRAPIGLLSPRKSLAVAGGGVLCVNDEALWEKAPAQLPPADGGAQAFLKRRDRWRKLTPFLKARGMASLIGLLRSLKGPARPDASGERELPGPAGPSPSLLEPVSVADPQIEVQRRRSLYAACERLLHGLVEPVFRHWPADACPYAFPFRADKETAAKAAALLRRHGVLVDPWPDLPGAAKVPRFHRTVHLAQFLW